MIRLLGEDDVEAFVEHVRRIRAASGRDGDPIFNPRSADEPFEAEERRAQARTGWARPTTQPGWSRVWGCDVDGVLRGHLSLKSGTLTSELHRATIGMGLERPARRRGHGRTMLTQAIAWARTAGLAWLDLYVFANNAPARALYAAIGFVEVGMHRDRFRIDGVSVDDIAMTYALC